MDLQGRAAIVTGGAGGLGAATVRHLVGIGMRVAVFDRDGDCAAVVAKELDDAAAAVAGDTTDDDDVAAAIDVRVCAIAPGTMGTPIMLSVNEELKERLVKDIQFPKRMGKPEEFALLVESIARNPYLNGENFRLDGALRFPPK